MSAQIYKTTGLIMKIQTVLESAHRGRGSNFLKTFLGILFWNFFWKYFLEIFFGNIFWKYFLEIFFGNMFWKYFLEIYFEVFFGWFFGWFGLGVGRVGVGGLTRAKPGNYTSM
jgi:hypothetical protein